MFDGEKHIFSVMHACCIMLLRACSMPIVFCTIFTQQVHFIARSRPGHFVFNRSKSLHTVVHAEWRSAHEPRNERHRNGWHAAKGITEAQGPPLVN